MATEAERAELARLSSGSSPLVHVIEVPKLSEVLAPLIPRAAVVLRDWDAKVEDWRKSIFFDSTRRGGGIVAVGSTATATPQEERTTIINNTVTVRQIYTGVAPPTTPDYPTLAALFYPDGGGPMQQWSVPDQAWV